MLSLKRVLVLSFLLWLVVAAGCVYRLTDFTIISTRNVDLSRLGECQKYGHRVKGRHGITTCFGGPLFGGRPDMKTAIDRALDRVPGSVALVDGVVYESNWSFLDIFGGRSIIVEGTPLVETRESPPQK